MPVNSKQKGARFERLLASKFREYGYDARRTAQYCGNTGDASDVVGLTGKSICPLCSSPARPTETRSSSGA